MKIVLVGPSTAPYAREFISNAAATLRQRGHEVLVPHEGGWHPPVDPAASDRTDFETTYRALQEADLLLAVLDGYTVDDAVAAQLGTFYTLTREGGRQRRIVGLLFDTRVGGSDSSTVGRALTPYIRQCISQFGSVFGSLKDALAALESQGL